MIGRVFLFAILFVSFVSANHHNCTTSSCADLCNFQGTWVTTSNTGPDHGYCVCNDQYYTLDSDNSGSNDDDPTHPELGNCLHRRKWQSTAFLLHANVLIAPFAPAHWYLEHTGIAVAQMFFGLLGGTLWFYPRNTSNDQTRNVNNCNILCALIFGIWWLVDLFLFALSTHYKDVHGQNLIPF